MKATSVPLEHITITREAPALPPAGIYRGGSARLAAPQHAAGMSYLMITYMTEQLPTSPTMHTME